MEKDVPAYNKQIERQRHRAPEDHRRPPPPPPQRGRFGG